MMKFEIAIWVPWLFHHFVAVKVVFAKSQKKACNFRTRLTFRRPTRDNVLSILAGCGKGSELVPPNIAFNHESVGITKPPDDVDENSCSTSFLSRIGYPKFKKSRNSFLLFPKGVTVFNSITKTSNEMDSAMCTSRTVRDGWRVLRFYKTIGHGAKCYKKVRNAIFDWDFEADNGKKLVGIVSAKKQQYLWRQIHSEPTEVRAQSFSKWFISPRKTLMATFSEIRFPKPIKSIFVVNPVHVAYQIIDSKQIPDCMYSCTSYATLSGHLLTGEERVSVIWRKCSGGKVVVEILSFSRPGPSIGGKIVWPLVGQMQRSFFLEEIKHLERIGKS